MSRSNLLSLHYAFSRDLSGVVMARCLEGQPGIGSCWGNVLPLAVVAAIGRYDFSTLPAKQSLVKHSY